MKRIIRNTWSILSTGERRRFCFFMIANALVSVADIAFLALLIFMVGFYTHKTGFDFHLPSFIPYELLNPGSVFPAFLFLVFFILKNMGAYIAGHLQYRFIFKVALRIANGNLLYYLEGSYGQYADVNSSVHERKISQQPIEFCHYILTGLLQLFTELMLILLTISAVLWLNAKLFLLILAIMLPAVFILSYISRKKLQSARLHIKTTGEKTTQHLKEALSGYVESNIYDKKNFFSNRYLHYQAQLNKYLSDINIIQGLPSRFIEIFAVSGFFILVLIHHLYGNENAISLVTIGAFTVAAYKVIPGIAKILSIKGQIHAYEFTVSDILKDKRPNKNRRQPPSAAQAIYSILFRNVSFHYPGDQSKSSGWRINLCIQPGNMTGITGLSGKGKTTVINLLLGFLEPACGTIEINGSVTDAQQRQHYWKDIAYSRQHPFLIHDSILKNITLDDHHCHDQRLQEAVTASGLCELLERSPGGLHYVIAENGKNISGGQRKRMAIARAFYKNASLIILDEPFNELDETSCHSILFHLEKLAAQGKMIVLITHDKTSLSYCHKIISLDVTASKNADHTYARLSGK